VNSSRSEQGFVQCIH